MRPNLDTMKVQTYTVVVVLLTVTSVLAYNPTTYEEFRLRKVRSQTVPPNTPKVMDPSNGSGQYAMAVLDDTIGMAINVNGDEMPYFLRCNKHTLVCHEEQIVFPGVGVENAGTTTVARSMGVVAGNSSFIFTLSRTGPGTGHKRLYFVRCPKQYLDGPCVLTKILDPNWYTQGMDAFVWVDPVAPYTSYFVGIRSSPDIPVMYTCSLDGVCTFFDVVGSNPLFEPFYNTRIMAFVDHAAGDIVVSYNANGAPVITYNRCSLDGSGCTYTHTVIPPRSAFTMLPNFADDTVTFVTDLGDMWICALADATGCVAHLGILPDKSNQVLAYDDPADPGRFLVTGGRDFPYLFSLAGDFTDGVSLDTFPTYVGAYAQAVRRVPMVPDPDQVSKLWTLAGTDEGYPVLFVASPAAPMRSCPNITLEHGSVEYELDYPDWRAYPICNVGYGLVGSRSLRCGDGASVWNGGNPMCVFNATTLGLVLPSLTGVAGEGFGFDVYDAGAPKGFDTGGTTIHAVLQSGGGGVVLDTVLQSYRDGIFSGSVVLPQVAGKANISFGLEAGGVVVEVASAVVEVVPGPVLGRLISPAVTVTHGEELVVWVEMVDRFGNGVEKEVAEASLLGLGGVGSDDGEGMVVRLVEVESGASTGSELVGGGVLVAAGSNTWRVAFGMTPTLSGAHVIEGRMGGISMLDSPFAVNVTCGKGYKAEGSACTLVACPVNAVDISPVNLTIAVCVCDSGFTMIGVREDDGNPICVPCPPGAICPRGLDAPLARKGFFRDASGNFIACLRKNACPGGTTPCAPGYEGYMCSACVDGRYSDVLGDCVPCVGDTFAYAVSGVVGLVVGSVVLAAVTALGLKLGDGKVAARFAERKRTLPVSASLSLVAFQLVGILASADFEWSSSSSSVLGVFDLANIDVNLVANECSFDDPAAKYVVAMVLPLVLLVLVLVFLVLGKLARQLGLGQVSVRALFDAVTFSVAPLVYIPLTKAALIPFDCTQLPNGRHVLDADPSIPCFDNAWMTMAIPSGLLVLAFVLGLPLFFLTSLCLHRTTLLHPATFARFGALYKNIRVKYWWWPVVDLLKRLGIVASTLFLSSQPLFLTGVLLAILLVASYAVLALRPYFYPGLNGVDFRLTTSVVLVALLGVFSYAERNTNTSSTPTFLVATGVVVVFLVLISVFAVVVEVIEIVRTRRGRLDIPALRLARLGERVSHEVLDVDPEGEGIQRLFDLAHVLQAGGRGGASVAPAPPSLVEDDMESGELDDFASSSSSVSSR